MRNFYSVSISGYHIAEAGANPVSQLAFTLANGFTIAEYYLARGMKIDEFAPNLSFFFSNGMDPEYAVIGRVARRIWARAMRDLYQAGPRSQMLKYHIQTSGRSLHAQEIQFNDIRTTLQALYALFDNCNSLHTNAYDEAITTPTEESVRRAVAIQLIISKELGLNKTQNPWQGSFAIDQLTDLVEEAVYREFDRISERGGVLGAMETMYQRSKIQEESLHYETLKHDGTLPIVGVNTFLAEQDAQRRDPECRTDPVDRGRKGGPGDGGAGIPGAQCRAPAGGARAVAAGRRRRAATCSSSSWKPSRSPRWAASRTRSTRWAVSTGAACEGCVASRHIRVRCESLRGAAVSGAEVSVSHARIVEHVAGRATQDDAPGFEHERPRRDVQRHVRVLLHQQDRRPGSIDVFDDRKDFPYQAR